MGLVGPLGFVVEHRALILVIALFALALSLVFGVSGLIPVETSVAWASAIIVGLVLFLGVAFLLPFGFHDGKEAPTKVRSIVTTGTGSCFILLTTAWFWGVQENPGVGLLFPFVFPFAVAGYICLFIGIGFFLRRRAARLPLTPPPFVPPHQQ